jgi:hypothetical protein
VWRSLVAHLHGVQGVGGSSPLTPTNKIKDLASKGAKSFLVGGLKCEFTHPFTHPKQIAPHQLGEQRLGNGYRAAQPDSHSGGQHEP